MINAIRSYCTIRNADERLNLGRFQGEDISFAKNERIWFCQFYKIKFRMKNEKTISIKNQLLFLVPLCYTFDSDKYEN